MHRRNLDDSKRTWGLEMTPDSSGVDSGDVASTVRRLTASVMTSLPTAQDKFSGSATEDHRLLSSGRPSAPARNCQQTPATALRGGEIRAPRNSIGTKHRDNLLQKCGGL